MANQNIRTPRFYIDEINYHLARGQSQSSYKLVPSGSSLITAYSSGSDAELFDMRPMNQCSWDTTNNAGDSVLINADLATTSARRGFIAILNHNLVSCSGKISIFAGDEAGDVNVRGANTADTADWDSSSMAEVVNADAITALNTGDTGIDGRNIAPATDGTTIVTFDDVNVRHWGIDFSGAGTGNFSSSVDLKVGCILIGEVYSTPHSPELNVTRTINFDKNTITESQGGQRYSNMTSFGASSATGNKSPFTLGTNNRQVFGGRRVFNLNFNYLDSSNVLPTEYSNVDDAGTNDSFVQDVWNKTHGSHLPFIFSIDSESAGANAESEHMFARFGQNNLQMSQVAPDVYNMKLKIEEEF